MKKKSGLVFIFLTFFLTILVSFNFFVGKAAAHVGIPFVNINGTRTVPNTILAGSSFFKIANEFAAENYLLGTNLDFTVEATLMPVSPDTVGDNNFTWSFGDEASATGLSASHSYKKSGSYIVLLNAKDPASGEHFELESLRVNIVPSKNYSLPEAVITVDGKKIIDPVKESIKISSGQSISLTASSSKGKGLNYLWDLGDGSSTVKEKAVTHNFTFGSLTYSFTLFPILRVTDENGLVADTYVQLSGKSPNQNSSNQAGNNGNKNSTSTFKSSSTNYMLWLILGAGILVVGSGVIFLRRQVKKK